MTNTELYLELNDLVSRFLEAGGDPSILAERLREIADDVLEEEEEDSSSDETAEGKPE